MKNYVVIIVLWSLVILMLASCERPPSCEERGGKLVEDGLRGGATGRHHMKRMTYKCVMP